MSRDPAQAAGMIDITTNSISMASRLPSLGLSVRNKYNNTRSHNEKIRMIKNVAMNDVKEDDMELCEYMLRNNKDFLSLAITIQKEYYSESKSMSRSSTPEKRSESKTKARRLRIAMRRVLKEDGHLPPRGDPLIPGDEDAESAHTPPAERLREEEAAHKGRDAREGVQPHPNLSPFAEQQREAESLINFGSEGSAETRSLPSRPASNTREDKGHILASRTGGRDGLSASRPSSFARLINPPPHIPKPSIAECHKWHLEAHLEYNRLLEGLPPGSSTTGRSRQNIDSAPKAADIQRRSGPAPANTTRSSTQNQVQGHKTPKQKLSQIVKTAVSTLK